MASNNIEERVINQVKKLNEGILDSIARMFMARKEKQHYKKAYKVAKDDPELMAALTDLEGYQKRLNRMLKTLCKRNPEHPKCN